MSDGKDESGGPSGSGTGADRASEEKKSGDTSSAESKRDGAPDASDQGDSGDDDAAPGVSARRRAGGGSGSVKVDPTAGMSEQEAKEWHAARRIQAAQRSRRARQMLRDMLSQVFEKVYDEETGAFFYYNKHTGDSQWTKPKLLKEDEDVELTPRSKAAALAASQREIEDDAGGGETERKGEEDTASDGRGPDALVSQRSGATLRPLRDFLEDHELLQYANALEEEGFDTLKALAAAERDDLTAIGMKKGHQRVLAAALADELGGPTSLRSGESSAGRDPQLFLDLAKRGIGGGKASSRSSLGSASRSRRSSASHGSRHTRGGTSVGTGVVAKRKVAIEDEPEPPDIPLETLFDGDMSGTPEEGQIIRVHYVGQFLSGKTFESSRVRGRPFQFKLGVGQVIEGWDIALLKMTRGQRARFVVPPELAYGVEGRPPVIPPNCPLQFEVEMIDFFDPDVELTPRSQYDPEIDGTPRDGEDELA